MGSALSERLGRFSVWSRRATDIQFPGRSAAGPTPASLELEKFRAQMESDNKFLAELDRARSALGKPSLSVVM